MARPHAKANASRSPAPQAPCSSAHTQGGSSPQTGSSTAARPFVPEKLDLPILDDDGGHNYDLWGKALTLAFRNRGLWPVVNGSETAPDATTDPAEYDE